MNWRFLVISNVCVPKVAESRIFLDRHMNHARCRVHPALLPWFFLICCALVPSLTAADKSGVSPNAISLPKGPGSIEGLGESFQPTLNTGTASYGLTLRVIPGTAGQTPVVRLSYEGGGGNGIAGYGWTLGHPYIQRRTDKGLPTYGLDVGFPREDVFINEMKEELVPQQDGFFRCKNERAFIRYAYTNAHWVAQLPDGERLEFGVTEKGRIQSSNGGQVFSWLLERETDTRGNVILYRYDSFAGDENRNQKYLVEIAYGPGGPPWKSYHFIEFGYEARKDWFEDCRAGFEVRTGMRLKSVLAGTQGPVLTNHLKGDFNGDGLADYLNYRYDLGYSPYAGTNSHWSLLASVKQVGADAQTSLPPATFGYAVCNPPDEISAGEDWLRFENTPEWLMDNELVDLVDLNGDGLPDLLKTDLDGFQQQGFLNRGSGDSTSKVLRWDSAAIVADVTSPAVRFNLSADTTHLADMDGDGLADLVHKTALDEVFYFKNSGRLGWGGREDMSIDRFAPPAPFGESDVRVGDFDFDKRIDVIQSIGQGVGTSYRIWFNMGGNQYSAPVTVEQGIGFSFGEKTVQIADLNGDRVPDLAWVRAGSVQIMPGLGYGKFGSVSNCVLSEEIGEEQLQNVKLTDLNGDGLADVVLERGAPGECWYWLNLGNYSFEHRKRVVGLPTRIGVKAATRWADINGNGTVDLVYADSAAEPEDRLVAVDLGRILNCAPVPNVLTVISNGIGRGTWIEYQPSTHFSLQDLAANKPWTNSMPLVVSVVASVTNFDSMGHAYVSRYRYHDGYYDSAEKQFRGFGQVEQIDVGDSSAPTLVTRNYFDTGREVESMKGKLLEQMSEQEDGQVFSQIINSWSIPSIVLMTGTNGTNVSFIHPTRRLNRLIELGQGTEKTLESIYEYDAYGNRTLDADYGIVESEDPSAWNDERVTRTEFAINTNKWILRSPKAISVADADGRTISRMEMFYDDPSFSGLQLGEVTVGNLTMKREWVAASNALAFVTSARIRYDTYGNPIMYLDPLCKAPAGVVDFGNGHVRTLDYDPFLHAYAIRENIFVGASRPSLSFSVDFDEGLATVLRSVDFNSNETAYRYDALGRIVSIVRPEDSSTFPTVEYDYGVAIPFQKTNLVNFVETRRLDKSSEVPGTKRDHYFIVREYVDGLSRKLMTKHEAGFLDSANRPRVVVKGAVDYNQRSKVSRELNPFYSMLSGSLEDQMQFESITSDNWVGEFESEGRMRSLTKLDAHASTYEYDATLRETIAKNADGTFRRSVYEPLIKRLFDENDLDPGSPHFGTPTSYFNDGLNRLVKLEETSHFDDEGRRANTIQTWATHYIYDVNDQLTGILDSQNNTKRFFYDGLKRRVRMEDPDRGNMSWTYDDASNVIETTDAKNQRITYTYDGVNRILTEDYHDEKSQLSFGHIYEPQRPISLSNRADVVFFYDVATTNLDLGDTTYGTARNVKGRLAFVWDLSGEEHTSYDSRDRVEWTVKRIIDSPFEDVVSNALPIMVSYKTAFSYDSMERLVRLVYPDNDEITYEYNDRNLLARIRGGLASKLTSEGYIISAIDYWPSDQQREIRYGNGIRTTYAHDARLRLEDLFTAHTTNGVNPMIAFHYDFDPVSNIRAILDNRSATTVSAGDKRRNTQLFEYDDVYRLIRARYSFAPKDQSFSDDGEINYRYDRISNMLAQVSTIHDFENGVPTVDLGQMLCGGPNGRWNRGPRTEQDVAGPHALTAIRSTTANVPERNYAYDDNGNMIQIDGANCSWDFKDRLVRIESPESVSRYIYDYKDKRIVKQVKHRQN